MSAMIGFICLNLWAASLDHPQEHEGWSIEKISLNMPVAEGKTIEIHNPYGDVRARGGQDRTAAVSAMIQYRIGDAHKMTFQTEESEQKLVLRVVYAGPVEDTIKAGGKRRADVTIFVPPGCPYAVRTHKGLIEVKGVKDAVDLESFSGNIFFRNEGHARAKTHQGKITAIFIKPVWEETAVLESVIGDISLQLPQDANVTVHAQTAGILATDYSITIKKDTHQIKHGQTVIGEGTYRMEVLSKTGQIQILEGKWDLDRD